MRRARAVDAYRFSISWPRVQPDGRGAANRRGPGLLRPARRRAARARHHAVGDALPLGPAAGARGRRRLARPRHRRTGSPSTPRTSPRPLGDRVSHWITLNEPWCSAFLGYGSGIHAPGRSDARGGRRRRRTTCMLGHGLAVEALRERGAGRRRSASRSTSTRSRRPTTRPRHGGRRRAGSTGCTNRWFLDPVLRGSYPEDVVDDLGPPSPTWRSSTTATSRRSRAPLDFLGVNYYTRHVVRSRRPARHQRRSSSPHRGLPTTAIGWEVDPEGLTDILARVSRATTRRIPLYVTENGCRVRRRGAVDGRVHDPDRRRLPRGAPGRLGARPSPAGAPLRGYFAWSLLDNFEWAEGYAKRFGIVHVDFETQVRTVKASGRWYAEFLAGQRARY